MTHFELAVQISFYFILLLVNAILRFTVFADLYENRKSFRTFIILKLFELDLFVLVFKRVER
jgi:hypothetical protein